MEIMTVKRIAAALAAVLAALPLLSQETEYSLPETTVKVKVETVKETFFAGPYARYAKKLLGIDVHQEDYVDVAISEISISSSVGADLKTRYSLPVKFADQLLAFSSEGLVAFARPSEAASVTWRFSSPASADFSRNGLTETETVKTETTYRNVKTDSTFTRIPVQEQVSVIKSLEQRAKEAASMILSARRERYNIASGNTDATFSGEALRAALDELSSVEKEYLTLFAGYSVTTTQTAVYEITPDPWAKSQTYTVFRLSGVEGLLPEGSSEGEPYLLIFDTVSVPEPEDVPEKVKPATRYVHYRVPAVCDIRLTDGFNTLLKTTVPVYQLGRECTHPIANK